MANIHEINNACLRYIYDKINKDILKPRLNKFLPNFWNPIEESIYSSNVKTDLKENIKGFINRDASLIVEDLKLDLDRFIYQIKARTTFFDVVKYYEDCEKKNKEPQKVNYKDLTIEGVPLSDKGFVLKFYDLDPDIRAKQMVPGYEEAIGAYNEITLNTGLVPISDNMGYFGFYSSYYAAKEEDFKED